MANIKVLKFNGGIPTEINQSLDTIVALSFLVGGPSGTALTLAILNVLTGGAASDASSLHSHDSRYYTKSQHINASTGAPSAALPINTDARGKIDPTFYQQSDISHSALSNLSNDDHPQYYNAARLAAAVYLKTQFISISAGATDAAKPVLTNSQGQIDGTLLGGSASSINHENLSGLLGGAASDHYHFTGAEHTTLAGGTSDASTLHNHNTQYYTKVQVDTSLALKANDNIVIKKDGSVVYTAAQSMGGFKLTNVADGASAQDATAYHQLTDGLALKVSKSGDTMTGALNMTGNLISGVADPVNPQDAATKNYVDSARAGLIVKDPVKVATLGDTTLSGPQTIDGVSVVAGDRVLVRAQTTGSQNGIYVVAAGAWTRASDSTAFKEGTYVFVDLGSTYARSAWVISTPDPISVGSTSITWTRYNAAGQLVAGTGINISGDTIAVNLGAGVTNLPTGEVGIDLFSSAGLQLVDPTTGLPSTASNAQLAHKLADATLTVSASGLSVGVIQTANIADQSVTTAKHADQSVTQTKLANASVGTAQLIDANVTTVKILDANVTGAKLAANAAGIALSQNVSTKALDVQVDNTSIDVNGSNQIEVKALGITTAKIAAQAVDSTKVLFSTTGNGVNASVIPTLNANAQYAASNVDAALNEIADSLYVTKAFTSGEALATGDLVALRRDASNAVHAYKASGAGADNVIAASKIVQDITYTAVSSVFASGNATSVAYTNPGAANAALSVSVSGNAITVSLATNGSAAITSTATQIQAAVAANGLALALVTSVVSGTGSTIQTVQAQTFLTGGSDYNDNGRWSVYGVAMDAAASAGTSIRIKKLGALACNFVSTPSAADIGKEVYLSINKGMAAVAAAPVSTNDGIVHLGRLISATQVEFRSAVLRGVNG